MDTKPASDRIDFFPNNSNLFPDLKRMFSAMDSERQNSCGNLIYATNSSVGNISFSSPDYDNLHPTALKEREDELKLQLAATRQRICLFEESEQYISEGLSNQNAKSLEGNSEQQLGNQNDIEYSTSKGISGDLTKRRINLKQLEQYEKDGKLKSGQAKEIIESYTNTELELLLINLTKL